MRIGAAFLIALCGCAIGHDGVVKTSDQAISIADQACQGLVDHLPGRWHVRWEHIEWFVWHDPDYSLEVSIDDRTGKVIGQPGCLVNPRDGVYVGD
jgi:hypothetical protein